MLKIYQSLFDKLSEHNISHCVYKGLSHLKDDLNGKRGDIDILCKEEQRSDFIKIAKNLGFFLCLNTPKPRFLIGLDDETLSFVMIDLSTKVLFNDGNKKLLSVNLDKVKLDRVMNINVIHKVDYAPLLFLLKINSKNRTQKDLNEIKQYIQKPSNDEPSYLSKLVGTHGLNWQDASKELMNSTCWSDLEKGHSTSLNLRLTNEKKLFQHFISRLKSFVFRKMQIPAYQIRKKGLLIAFIGVDGSGKSSTIEHLLNIDFFNLTGIKRIYFGDNEYWIPGLKKALSLNSNIKAIKYFIALLVFIDKQLRVMPLLYYKNIGHIVLADRYFYDEKIADLINHNEHKKRNKIKRFLHELIKPKKIITPDITFFLDPSPSVAYSRKQDHSLSKLKDMINHYKDYMLNQENVIRINADNEQQKNIRIIIKQIMNLHSK